MDEIEFKQAFTRLTRLINTPQRITEHDTNNALKIIADILVCLHDRITEIQNGDPDEDEGIED